MQATPLYPPPPDPPTSQKRAIHGGGCHAGLYHGAEDLHSWDIVELDR